jgi:hypothetical protein
MAVKRYDGTAWQVVAGKGDQGTSSSISTWVKTASGGETSVSGNDDNSQPLSYTVGQELVFINGVLQKRGDDYTATTGNSITGLTALTAGDIVSVWTVNAFSVSNAISNTIVDAKGDILVGTGADTPGRLAVGSNNQVLTADSTTGTGLKWATPATGGKVLQVVTASTTTSTTVASTSYTDTTLTATITPTSTTSTILVMVSQFGYQSRNSTSINGSLQIVRGVTSIYNADFSSRLAATGATAVFLGLYTNLIYKDSPATTSATTYKTQGKVSTTADSGQIVYQDNSAPSTITLLEIGA